MTGHKAQSGIPLAVGFAPAIARCLLSPAHGPGAGLPEDWTAERAAARSNSRLLCCAGRSARERAVERPDEACELARNGGDHDGRPLAAPRERAEAPRQPRLRLPGDLLRR